MSQILRTNESSINCKMLYIINKNSIFVENNKQNEIKEKHNLPKTSGNYGTFGRKYQAS